MKLPIIEFKFKFETLNKEIVEQKMMVSLEDIWFIDERHLYVRGDDYNYELVEGEYDRFRETLISSAAKDEIIEECDRRNKMERAKQEITQKENE